MGVAITPAENSIVSILGGSNDVPVKECTEGVGWFMQHAGMYKVVGSEKLRNEVQERIQSAWKVYSR